jgi:hypothetical protein
MKELNELVKLDSYSFPGIGEKKLEKMELLIYLNTRWESHIFST